MSRQKNVAGQFAYFLAIDSATNRKKAGDGANITCFTKKDNGTVAAIAANGGKPTEVDAVNATGWYQIPLSQAESDCDTYLDTANSSTPGIEVYGEKGGTEPPNFNAAKISPQGASDANVVETAGVPITPLPPTNTVTGSRDGNEALAALLTILAAQGTIIDNSTV